MLVNIWGKCIIMHHQTRCNFWISRLQVKLMIPSPEVLTSSSTHVLLTETSTSQALIWHIDYSSENKCTLLLLTFKGGSFKYFLRVNIGRSKMFTKMIGLKLFTYSLNGMLCGNYRGKYWKLLWSNHNYSKKRIMDGPSLVA